MNWADLTDGTIVPVEATELGDLLSEGLAWTNVATDGTLDQAGEDCLGWTSSSSSDVGGTGLLNSPGSNWTNHGLTPTCDTELQLYCVRQ